MTETTGELEPRMVRQVGGRMSYREDGSPGWISGAIKHPGALHRELGVPQGQKIPAKMLARAAHSDNPTLARRARLAQTLRSMQRGK